MQLSYLCLGLKEACFPFSEVLEAPVAELPAVEVKIAAALRVVEASAQQAGSPAFAEQVAARAVEGAVAEAVLVCFVLPF